METFEGRLHTFDKPKSKPSSKAASNRAWPHPHTFAANPKSLAEAGFFFKPSKEDPDNVRCFICKKELGGWDEEDNPFEIHVNKCPKCPWAIARCSLEFDVDSDGNFSLKDSARLPTNKTLEKARVDTFGGKKWWPHDSVKNHGATSKKMAKAGFVYTPQTEGDDTATCFYCDLSLSGWDAEDDPTEEHNKRVERTGKPCPFFETAERPKSQASSKSTKSRQSRAPKQTAPESDDSEEEEPAPLKASTKKGKQKLSEATTSSTTSTALKKSVKPPSTVIEADDSEELEEDDDPSLKVKPTPAPRKSSRKPTSKSKSESKASGKGKQPMPALSEEAEASDGDDGEADSRPPRSRAKSTKEKKKEKGEKEKETNKPPSNVDGKIIKPYEEYSVDIEEAEEKRKGRAKKEDFKASRNRSRSTSKPRSTDVDRSRKSSLADSQSKPLLRAASRPRVSEIAELEDEEMETEKLLNEPSPESEPEPEEKLPSKARKAKKAPAPAESDVDEPRQNAASASKPTSVISEKSSSIKMQNGNASEKKAEAPSSNSSKNKKAAKARSKERGPDSSKPFKSSQQLEQDGDDVDGYTDFQDDGAVTDARDMDVDEPFEPGVPENRAEMDAEMGDYDDFVPNRTSFPSRAPPPDLKGSKPPSSKSKSKINFDASAEPIRSQTPGVTSTDSVVKEKASKPLSVKAHTSTLKPSFGKHRNKPASQRSEGHASHMDIDGDNENKAPRPQKEDRAAEAPARATVPLPAAKVKNKSPLHPHSPEPAPETAQISRPATPEDQIVRLESSKPTHNGAPESDFQTSLQVPPSPADLFLPALANAPLEAVAALTDAERGMTVEQWIRHEMSMQYERLKEDGERRIRAFLEQAEETRKQIEAL